MENINDDYNCVINDFEDLNLKNDLLRGIYAYGFEKPSEIQSRAIYPISQGKDVIAQSQSGTGKTGAFIIGILQRLKEEEEGNQILIIVPTRELAIQIVDVCTRISSYMKGVKTLLCIGKQEQRDVRETLEGLRSGCNIIIGTPGRVIDLIEGKQLKIDYLLTLVVDEADEMLSNNYGRRGGNNNGFQDQIRTIVGVIPKNCQICLFSATMPYNILKVTEKFITNPVKILVKKEELTLEGIKQYYINVEKEFNKFGTFCDIFGTLSLGQSIVYVNSKKKAETIKEDLQKKKFTVSVIHSNMTQQERTEIISEFRKGATRILVSTDLLSRGIDIQQISVVINYDIPFDKSCYLHRIGRSGRFGRKGTAINFVTNGDIGALQDIEKYYNTEIQEYCNEL